LRGHRTDAFGQTRALSARRRALEIAILESQTTTENKPEIDV